MSSPANVALFVDRGHHLESVHAPDLTSGKYHIFLPFFGGPDNHLALNFARTPPFPRPSFALGKWKAAMTD